MIFLLTCFFLAPLVHLIFNEGINNLLEFHVSLFPALLHHVLLLDLIDLL